MKPEINKIVSITLFGRMKTSLLFALEQVTVNFSNDFQELNSIQILILSIFYSILIKDIEAVLFLIELATFCPGLRSSFYREWLRTEFNFQQEHVAKVLSILADLVENKGIEVPKTILVILSSLEEKYDLFEFFRINGDTNAQILLAGLNPYVTRAVQTEPEPTEGPTRNVLLSKSSQTDEEFNSQRNIEPDSTVLEQEMGQENNGWLFNTIGNHNAVIHVPIGGTQVSGIQQFYPPNLQVIIADGQTQLNMPRVGLEQEEPTTTQPFSHQNYLNPVANYWINIQICQSMPMQHHQQVPNVMVYPRGVYPVACYNAPFNALRTPYPAQRPTINNSSGTNLRGNVVVGSPRAGFIDFVRTRGPPSMPAFPFRQIRPSSRPFRNLSHQSYNYRPLG